MRNRGTGTVPFGVDVGYRRLSRSQENHVEFSVRCITTFFTRRSSTISTKISEEEVSDTRTHLDRGGRSSIGTSRSLLRRQCTRNAFTLLPEFAYDARRLSVISPLVGYRRYEIHWRDERRGKLIMSELS